jgi:hypothetical protein
MATHDDANLVSRADLLMQRRRNFVATPTTAPVAPSNVAASTDVTENDDIPVLTEVLSAEHASTTITAPVGATSLPLLSAELRQAIEQHLDRELPGLLAASVGRLEADLRRSMLAAMDAALKELIGSSN